MNLWAISDLHVGYPVNREAVASLAPRPGDWLILGGDLGETVEQVAWVLDTLGPRFAKLLWVPGNHELWTMPAEAPLRGESKYRALIAACRERGALTPEDPWPLWPGEGPPTIIAPLFLLFDYTFAPPGVDPIAWAAEEGIRSTDEARLDPHPHPSIPAWCAERLRITEERLKNEVPAGHRLILVNHYPLRRDLVRLYTIPRFLPWCGTAATEDWHTRYPADVVVNGHLHMRATDWRDGVRFEEVALGYPRHWRQEAGADFYVRRILPRPGVVKGTEGPVWHR